jgi:hypothetical protein
MAYVNVPKGELFLVEVGEPTGNTVVFTHNALINSNRNLSISMETEEDIIVDLANMSAPGQKVRASKAIDVKIDGSGKLDQNSVVYWTTWMQTGQPKTIKYRQASNAVTMANAAGALFGTGPFLCTSFQVTAETQKYSEVSITLEQAGPVTFSAAT